MKRDVALILLGWLLGLMAQAIVWFLARRRKAIQTQKIIVEAFKDVKLRLSSLAFTEKCRLGMVDKDFVIWLKKQEAEYDGFEGDKKIRKDFLALDEQDDVAVSRFVSACNASGYSDTSYTGMDASFIDLLLPDIGMLARGFVVRSFEIRFQIMVFNHLCSQSNEYLKMTFDSSLSGGNRDIISSELRVVGGRIAKRSEQIVDKINQLMDSSLKS